MSHHRRSRHRVFLLTAVPFLLAAVAAPASAAIFDAEVVVTPEVPTWREPVTVTVRGESDCVVYVADTFIGFATGVGPVIRVDLDETCTLAPPQVVPFEVSAELGRLEPLEYTVQARQAGGSTVFAESELTVYELTDVEIVPPSEAPTDAAPFTFTVSAYETSCLQPSIVEVTEDAIVVDYPVDCPILPPGPTVVDTELEVGPLAPGEYEIRVFRQAFVGFDVAKQTVRVYDAEGCVPSPTVLCLNGDRFRVEVGWQGFRGQSGPGRTVPLHDDTGAFWFFDQANLELTVKVLDGCPVNGHYWVFVASGSTVEYEIEVTDTQARQTRTYRNELGEVPALIPDTDAFATCP